MCLGSFVLLLFSVTCLKSVTAPYFFSLFVRVPRFMIFMALPLLKRNAKGEVREAQEGQTIVGTVSKSKVPEILSHRSKKIAEGGDGERQSDYQDASPINTFDFVFP